MEHKVVSKFTDEETGRFYPKNSFYEGEDAKRVLFLHKKGFIEPNKNFEGGTDENSKKSSQSTTKKTGTKKTESKKESTPEKGVKADE